MNPRNQFLLHIFLLVSFAGVAYLIASGIDRTSMTFEHRWHRMINTEIQKDLCSRISKDLGYFRDNPNTFRRTSPQTIEGETKVLLRSFLKLENIPDTFPIEYTGQKGKYAKCFDELRRWLEIPSTDRYSRAEELAYVGGTFKESEKSAPASTGQTTVGLLRVALVIGNSNYANRPLINPKNDAEDMAKTLEGLGFEVIKVIDGTTEKTRESIDQFVSKLLSREIGFIYLSGHGIEYQGRNYFLPVNTRFQDPDEIPRIALDVNQVTEKLGRAGDKLSILVVDACRDSPVLSTEKSFKQGLIQTPTVKGALVGFSTSPGSVAEDGKGRNSPYTKHLIRNLQRKGVKIEDVFKLTTRDVEIETAGRQVPWYSSNLRADISLH